MVVSNRAQLFHIRGADPLSLIMHNSNSAELVKFGGSRFVAGFYEQTYLVQIDNVTAVQPIRILHQLLVVCDVKDVELVRCCSVLGLFAVCTQKLPAGDHDAHVQKSDVFFHLRLLLLNLHALLTLAYFSHSTTGPLQIVMQVQGWGRLQLPFGINSVLLRLWRLIRL